MEITISPESVCVPSDKIACRDINGRLIIVPIAAGIGGQGDEIFSLNSTGRAIWERLDGKRNLAAVAADLISVYEVSEEQIVHDVLEFAGELIKRKIIICRE